MKLQGNEKSGGGGGKRAELFALVAVDGKDFDVKTRSSTNIEKQFPEGKPLSRRSCLECARDANRRRHAKTVPDPSDSPQKEEKSEVKVTF